MDRVTGAYKRHTQLYLLIIGFAVAVVFNVDILNVYGNLSTNASLSNQIADQAAMFIGNTSRPDSLKLEGTNIDSLSQKILVLLSEDQIGALKSPLGLGWEWQTGQYCFCACWSCAGFWLLKLTGWLTTALGISLGATFWFDALKNSSVSEIRELYHRVVQSKIVLYRVVKTVEAGSLVGYLCIFFG
jgi:hypothetical protein